MSFFYRDFATFLYLRAKGDYYTSEKNIHSNTKIVLKLDFFGLLLQF
jgi:hypothetical protein